VKTFEIDVFIPVKRLLRKRTESPLKTHFSKKNLTNPVGFVKIHAFECVCVFFKHVPKSIIYAKNFTVSSASDARRFGKLGADPYRAGKGHFRE
jgi:hypothetical protein